MAQRIDMLGRKYGSLTVVGDAPKVGHNRHVYCNCDCGTKGKSVDAHHLVSGRIVGCGCVQLQRNKKRLTTHDKTNTHLYTTWCNIKARCLNKNNNRFNCYGGRGISVCIEWLHDFKAFYDWATVNGYRDNLTIDRINVDGNYEPSNCRWVTRQIQSRNTRKNIYVEYNGRKITLPELSEITGIGYYSLFKRYKNGERGATLLRPRHVKLRNKFRRLTEKGKELLRNGGIQ